MKILAIDPGSEKSAFIAWDTEKHEIIKGEYVWFEDTKILGIENNEYIIDCMLCEETNIVWGMDLIAIEMISSYGFSVGKSVFQTIKWIGRFEEYIKHVVNIAIKKNVPVQFYTRPTIKGALGCRNDAEVRQAIRMEYGEARKGEKLERVRKDIWQAVALAIALEKNPNLKQWEE
ncbi:hypothetical protein M0R01_03675 [bacterium]|nr:hypothetical protein [bacterium]